MTCETELPGWLTAAKPKETNTPQRPARRARRPHAGMILELALLLALSALLPRGGKRK